MKRLPLYFLGLALLCNLVGCETGKLDPQAAAAAAVAPALGEDVKSVAKDKAPLYESGPEQMNPPEAKLERDALVKIIRTEFGYSLIETQAGEMGWMANEDLANLRLTTAE
jgi:hypothetical protein